MAWYKEAVFYELYVPSFKDGNNDGIGDFIGAIERLDYLKELGITGIWLTPIFPSPRIDNGYDISDYYSIDPLYGDMSDFECFLQKAHQLGIRVIMDLVLNHTSDQHEWFKSARSSIESPYRDYYIWSKTIPNNWESFFAGSAWEYDCSTQEYYYHAFAKEQVDLNWSNPKVKEEMFNVISFWLDKGVDGFRLDVINFLKTDLKKLNQSNPMIEGNQIHLYDKNHEKTIPLIREMRSFVDQWPERYLLGEVGNNHLEELMVYVGDDLLHSVFNFNLGSIDSLDVAKMYLELIKMEQNECFPTLFFSSHDMSRHMTRLCRNDIEVAKVMAAMILLLKGISFIYQGDEIGMTDLIALDVEDMNDIQGKLIYQIEVKNGNTQSECLELANKGCRDKSRSPIQWDCKTYAGFSTSQPWLPVVSNYRDINVQDMMKNSNSLWCVYQELINIRKEYLCSEDKYLRLEQKEGLLIIERLIKKGQLYMVFCFEKDVVFSKSCIKGDVIFSTKERKELCNGLVLSKEVVVLYQKEGDLYASHN